MPELIFRIDNQCPLHRELEHQPFQNISRRLISVPTDVITDNSPPSFRPFHYQANIFRLVFELKSWKTRFQHAEYFRFWFRVHQPRAFWVFARIRLLAFVRKGAQNAKCGSDQSHSRPVKRRVLQICRLGQVRSRAARRMVRLRLDHFGLDRADFREYWLHQKYSDERSVHGFQRRPEEAAAVCSDNCLHGFYGINRHAPQVRDWFEKLGARVIFHLGLHINRCSCSCSGCLRRVLLIFRRGYSHSFSFLSN